MGVVLGLILSISLSGCSTRVHYADHHFLSQPGKNFFHGEVRLNYYEFGQVEPIIFLHGFGGASYTWRHVFPAFRPERRVFLIDLKGFGLSARPRDGKYRVSDQAELIKAFIIQKNLQNVTLVGHSYGGAVALLTYLKTTELEPRIQSLILLNSASYPESLPNFIKILRIPLANVLLTTLTPTRLAVRRVLRKSFYNREKITAEMVHTYTFYNGICGSAYAARKTAEQIIPENIDKLIPRFQEIAVPVLLVWGYDDDIIPLACGLRLHHDIPGSQWVSIKKCGHITQEEKPSETVMEISRFLSCSGK